MKSIEILIYPERLYITLDTLSQENFYRFFDVGNSKDEQLQGLLTLHGVRWAKWLGNVRRPWESRLLFLVPDYWGESHIDKLFKEFGLEAAPSETWAYVFKRPSPEVLQNILDDPRAFIE